MIIYNGKSTESTNLFPLPDAKKCLLAVAKYLSVLITTFYQKSTINTTDLNKQLFVGSRKTVPRDMSKETLNH